MVIGQASLGAALIRLRRLGAGGTLAGLAAWYRLFRESNLSGMVRARSRWLGRELDLAAMRFPWADDERDALLACIPEPNRARDPWTVGVLEGQVLGAAGPEPRAPYPWNRSDWSTDPAHARFLQEPGRLQAASLLAALGAIERKPDLTAEALDLVDDFFEANPYMRGPHWKAVPTVGLRLVSLLLIKALVGAPVLVQRMGSGFGEQVYLHLRWLSSCADSRAIRDRADVVRAAALLVGAIACPGFPESEAWLAEGREGLVAEILAQTHPDGVGREQCHAADLQNLELALWAGRIAESAGIAMGEDFWTRVEAMGEYFAAWHFAEDPASRSGEVDVGRSFGIPQGTGSRSRTLLAALAVRFERREWARMALAADPGIVINLGSVAEVRKFEDLAGDTQSDEYLPQEIFPEGGRFFFRSSKDPSICLAFDAGEMGGGPLGATAHADALAITLEVDGEPVVVDPGTFLLRPEEGWPDYFRSTAAHSTLQLGWESSAQPGPEGTWHDSTRVMDRGYGHTAAGRVLMATAAHAGYSRDGRMIVHRRTVTRDAGDSFYLAVEDRLEGPTDLEVDFELHYHFHPSIPVIHQVRDVYQVPCGTGALCFRFCSPHALEIGATRGHRVPLRGWYAKGPGEVEPTWVLRAYGKGQLPILIRTAIYPG